MLTMCVQVVCYWGTWANYRPEAGKFTPEDVDPSLCTHLIYSFAGLEQANWTMKSLDPWMDLEVGGQAAIVSRTATVEAQLPAAVMSS